MSFCTDRSTWSFAFETSTLNFLIALPPTRRFHPHLISIFLFPFLPPSVKRYQRFLSRSRSHRLQSYVPQLLSPPENWFIDSLACTRTHGNIGYHVNPEQRLHTVSVPLTNARFRENWLRLSFHLNLRKIFLKVRRPRVPRSAVHRLSSSARANSGIMWVTGKLFEVFKHTIMPNKNATTTHVFMTQCLFIPVLPHTPDPNSSADDISLLSPRIGLSYDPQSLEVIPPSDTREVPQIPGMERVQQTHSGVLCSLLRYTVQPLLWILQSVSYQSMEP